MNGFKVLALAAVAGFLFTATPPKAQAQVGAEVAVAPDCPYGYYGPEWFYGGVFIGVGPWFHGADDFRGNVDNSFDPKHGYTGASPKVGEKPAAERRDPGLFKGNEMRDGRGHTGGEKK